MGAPNWLSVNKKCLVEHLVPVCPAHGRARKIPVVDAHTLPRPLGVLPCSQEHISSGLVSERSKPISTFCLRQLLYRMCEDIPTFLNFPSLWCYHAVCVRVANAIRFFLLLCVSLVWSGIWTIPDYCFPLGCVLFVLFAIWTISNRRFRLISVSLVRFAIRRSQ